MVHRILVGGRRRLSAARVSLLHRPTGASSLARLPFAFGPAPITARMAALTLALWLARWLARQSVLAGLVAGLVAGTETAMPAEGTTTAPSRADAAPRLSPAVPPRP